MSSTDTNNHYEIVIIGAGFSGVYQLYRPPTRLSFASLLARLSLPHKGGRCCTTPPTSASH